MQKVKKFRFYHYQTKDFSLEHPLGVIITPRACHVFHTPGTPKAWLKETIVEIHITHQVNWFYILDGFISYELDCQRTHQSVIMKCQ